MLSRLTTCTLRPVPCVWSASARLAVSTVSAEVAQRTQGKAECCPVRSTPGHA